MVNQIRFTCLKLSIASYLPWVTAFQPYCAACLSENQAEVRVRFLGLRMYLWAGKLS